MSVINGLSYNEDTFDLQNEIEQLKAQLKVSNLMLKDKEFVLNKKNEDYEFQLNQSKTEYNNLKDKFEKIAEAQRKLEKQNSNLEDRLLKIVQKYEDEQKTLLEDLTIAHSQLVEAKLTINNLEKDKEAFRQDCNLAVSLLQCKPGDFVKHSYSSLPVNLKERLGSFLSEEEANRLEENGQKEIDNDNQKHRNSLFKIPIFQPTAAAMMYSIQNVSMQQRSKYTEESNENTSNQNTMNLTNTTNEDSKISSSLLAQVLRKESEPPSKKSFKLFPYICLRCKKETVICSSSAQYDASDLTEESLNIKYAKPVENELISFTKQVETNQTNIDQTKPIKNNELSNAILII